MSSELPPEARARLLADARALVQPAAELLHGRYRLLREVGRGGMGVVYEAEDVALRRRVAVKRLNLPPGVGPGLAEQVLREARAAARLDHPNIAAVYDAHPDAIVLQFVEGRALSEVPDAPLRTLVAWMRDAARAVHHAHEHGIVHRDLKPHNLMVSGERVVVTDFGLAKELAVDTSLSLSGSVLGTPAYMPPEQAGGRAREVDARSDVYALGATLYDRLAGRPPFAERDLVALLRSVVEDEPLPLVRLAPQVPRDLARVVHKCLEKEKGRRYASAAELADDLERWLDGRAVLARPPTLRYRLAKGLRRQRGVVAAVAALLLVTLAAVIWNWAERGQRSAVEETLALVGDLNVLLENARDLKREDAAKMRVELDLAVARAREFLERHREAHQIEVMLGEALRERGESEAALAAFERALAVRSDYAPALLKRGILRSQLAGERLATGESSAELDALRADARADLSRIVDAEGSLSEVDRRLVRAELARLSDRPDEAKRLYEDVNRIAPHMEAPPALAAIALAQGDPDEAFRQAMSAMDLARGFAPAYVAQGASDTPEEAVQRAIRQHARAAAGADSTLTIEGFTGRFTDWAVRLAERKSTAGAYGLRATGELRRAARLEAEGLAADALAALERAIHDLGLALTIDPELAGALGDRAQAELERARLLTAEGRAEEAQAALERARADLARALELAPQAKHLQEAQERCATPTAGARGAR